MIALCGMSGQVRCLNRVQSTISCRFLYIMPFFRFAGLALLVTWFAVCNQCGDQCDLSPGTRSWCPSPFQSSSSLTDCHCIASDYFACFKTLSSDQVSTFSAVFLQAHRTHPSNNSTLPRLIRFSQCKTFTDLLNFYLFLSKNERKTESPMLFDWINSQVVPYDSPCGMLLDEFLSLSLSCH